MGACLSWWDEESSFWLGRKAMRRRRRSRQLPIKSKSTMVRNRRTRRRLRRDSTSRNVVDLMLPFLFLGDVDKTDAVAKEDCSSASVVAADGSSPSSSSCTKTMVSSGCIVMLVC